MVCSADCCGVGSVCVHGVAGRDVGEIEEEKVNAVSTVSRGEVSGIYTEVEPVSRFIIARKTHALTAE